MSKNGFLWTDVAGLSLSLEDKDILSHPFVSGVILFSRNFESISQLRELTRQIKSISSELVITVDQEGGRVQRFREGFTQLPAMGEWGSRYLQSPEKTKQAFAAMLQIMIQELRDVGMDSTLVPVLDLNYDRNTVIGHRSFGADKNLVAELGEFMIDQFHALHSPVTGKHFPGHGWVTVDSHMDLPIDDRSFDVILEQDLQPFLHCMKKCDAIMLAHIVYQNIDPLPVCFSSFWIQTVLRKQMEFQGLILSDDLSMQAVAKMGSYADRATQALTAGCDILLVCNARNGVIDILDHVSVPKNPRLLKRLQHYASWRPR